MVLMSGKAGKGSGSHRKHESLSRNLKTTLPHLESSAESNLKATKAQKLRRLLLLICGFTNQSQSNKSICFLSLSCSIHSNRIQRGKKSIKWRSIEQTSQASCFCGFFPLEMGCTKGDKPHTECLFA
jgi:hypothetical protein